MRMSLMRVMMVCLEEEWVYVVDGVPRDVAVMGRGNDQRLVHGDVAGHVLMYEYELGCVWVGSG